jgi:hypothetical protein
LEVLVCSDKSGLDIVLQESGDGWIIPDLLIGVVILADCRFFPAEASLEYPVWLEEGACIDLDDIVSIWFKKKCVGYKNVVLYWKELMVFMRLFTMRLQVKYSCFQVCKLGLVEENKIFTDLSLKISLVSFIWMRKMKFSQICHLKSLWN